MIEHSNSRLSLARQCKLLKLSRSGLYYCPRGESPENVEYMQRITETYEKYPFYGVGQMTRSLRRESKAVNPKRVYRLMRKMGLYAIAPGPNTSRPTPEHEKYPYLLRDMKIDKPDEVWCTDITYLRTSAGLMYLTAVMDWHSRYVLAWELSNTCDASFCVETLKRALLKSKPGIFNSDQGSQFTSHDFLKVLKDEKIRISMDGKGRVFDNIFIERLWRSVKYEEVYLYDYTGPSKARERLEKYFAFYDYERPHSALGGRTPYEAYTSRCKTTGMN